MSAEEEQTKFRNQQITKQRMERFAKNIKSTVTEDNFLQLELKGKESRIASPEKDEWTL